MDGYKDIPAPYRPGYEGDTDGATIAPVDELAPRRARRQHEQLLGLARTGLSEIKRTPRQSPFAARSASEILRILHVVPDDPTPAA